MTTAREVFEKTAAAAEIARDLPQPLRDFYKLGKRASASSKAEIKKITWKVGKDGKLEKVGPSEDYVRKARLFEQRMTDAELRLLVASYRDQKYWFPWGHLRILVSVRDPQRRHAYMTAVINGEWSAKTLIAAIQLGEQRTRRKCVGRKQTKPQSVEETLLRLQRLMESWIDIYDQVFVDDASVTAARELQARSGRANRKLQVEVFLRQMELYQIKGDHLVSLLRQFLETPT